MSKLTECGGERKSKKERSSAKRGAVTTAWRVGSGPTVWPITAIMTSCGFLNLVVRAAVYTFLATEVVPVHIRVVYSKLKIKDVIKQIHSLKWAPNCNRLLLRWVQVYIIFGLSNWRSTVKRILLHHENRSSHCWHMHRGLPPPHVRRDLYIRMRFDGH